MGGLFGRPRKAQVPLIPAVVRRAALEPTRAAVTAEFQTLLAHQTDPFWIGPFLERHGEAAIDNSTWVLPAAPPGVLEGASPDVAHRWKFSNPLLAWAW